MNIDADTRPAQPPAATRGWGTLYCYIAALIGLGLAVTGVVTLLFGLRYTVLPEVGLPATDYEYSLHMDPHREPTTPTAARLAEARDKAIEDRRERGVSSMIDGALMAGVGAPVLLWHLLRARRYVTQTAT